MVFIRWSKGTWKDDQCCYLLKKCKSKLQQGITLHQSEWPSSESLEITNAREGFEKKKKPSHSVGGNVNWHSQYE